MKKRLLFLKKTGTTILATWLGVYPLLTAIAWLLEPFLAELSLPLRNLVMSGLMVPIMVLVVMPAIHKFTSVLAASGRA